MDGFPTEEEMHGALEKRYGRALEYRFSRASVAVCGLGGLGSNIAVSLARAGVGKLCLIDFDKVELSNLNRQQYFVSQIGMYKTEALRENLEKIAPYMETVSHTVRVTPENIRELLEDADIICEAFDRPEEKAMLVNGVMECFPDKYLVAGSGMAGLASANSIRTRRVTERFYLCGDEKSDVADTVGLVSSRVMVCAAHQANMVLRLLAGEHET